MPDLKAREWLDTWEVALQERDTEPERRAALLFLAAALLQSDEGRWLMETIVDAHRKLGCSREELAYMLGHNGQRSVLEQLEQEKG